MEGGGQDEAKAASPTEVSIHRLPSIDARIFGRSADVAWLDACWAEGANVASIIAFGGVGKSALVWDWLRGMQRDAWRGAERVYGWSFYSQGTTDRATSADEFVSTALRWFGDPDPNAGSPWDKGERLAGLIRKQRVLLVLDGVEPLQWGPGPQEGSIKDPALSTLVRDLGAQNPGLCVITSRLPVQEAEEFAPVACRRLDLSTLTEGAGATLLQARGVRGTEEELREAVREYGGHGLALALLGSYLEEVAEGDVRRRREIGPLLEDERLGGHARRVMAAYERLFGGSSPEVAILRMLGLFDRPADEGEMGALINNFPAIPGFTDVLERLGKAKWNTAISRLRRVGLLAPDVSDKRMDTHPLVREHFGEWLRQESSAAWQEGHRRLYEHLKRKAKPLPQTVEEMEPLYAAMMHGCNAGKRQDALDDVWWKRIRRNDRAFSVRELGAFGSEAAVLSGFFEPAWEKVAPDLRESDQGLVLNEAGFVLRGLGRVAEATELMLRGTERELALTHWRNASSAASNFSELLQASGGLRDGLAQAQRSLELADKSGDASMRVATRSTVATALHAIGHSEEAVALFEEAERIQKERRTARSLLFSIPGFRYCEILLDQDLYGVVQERSTETLRWSEEAHLGPLGIALSHLSLGQAHLLAAKRAPVGDLALAASHFEHSVDGLRRAGTQDMLPLGLLARAALYAHTCAFDLARKDLDEAHRIATRCGFRLHEADAHLGYARLALAERNPAAAIDHLAKAHKIIDETGYHRRDRQLDELKAEADEMAKAAASPPTPPAPVPSPAPVPAPLIQQIPVTIPQTAPGSVATSALTSVYLAYGDEDLPFARRLYEALEAAGVPVFFREEDAVPGAHRHRSARRSIREYEHVILVCSERSLRASSVLSELDEMLSREFDDGASERIIPVLLDDYASAGWQPRHPDVRRAVLDRVALDMKGVDGNPAKFDKAMKRLLGALRSEPRSPLTDGAEVLAPPRASAPATHADDLRPHPAPVPAPTQGTRWPSKLSGAEVQELMDALLSAFPSRSALAQMVRVGLDENLDAVAAGGNLRHTLFELVRHAEAHGLVPALFDAALAAAPGNPDLRTLAAKRRE